MLCELNPKQLFVKLANMEPEERSQYVLQFSIDASTQTNLIKYSWIRLLEEPPKPKKKKGEKKVYNEGYSEAFEAFWQAYPKKVGKGTAFGIWQQIRKPEEELSSLCCAALLWQKRMWAKDSNKYVPKPENWLMGRRWEDEPPMGIDPKQAPRTYVDMNGDVREY